ncbi:hypothetical protein Tco_1137941 [Tanacetum coccineum]
MRSLTLSHYNKGSRESSSSKQTKSDPPPLKAYKPKIPYPQRLRKEKMEEWYAKFIDLIKEFKINVPLVDVLAGMPNYRKFLKYLASNKSKMEQISTAFLNEEYSSIVQNKLPKLEFMVIDVEEIPEQEEEVENNFEELPLESNLRIKISIQDPSTNLEMKPLPKHLEYAFLEKDYILPSKTMKRNV